MTSPARLYRASSGDLIRLANQALTVVAVRSGRQALGENAYWTLGSLRQVVDALDAALGSVGTALLTQARSGTFEVVEGPFAGDVVAATATSELWLNRARATLTGQTAPAIDNAHTAVSGLAHPRRCC